MKKVFMILITIGVVMLFGTAGASDVGNIIVGRALHAGIGIYWFSVFRHARYVALPFGGNSVASHPSQSGIAALYFYAKNKRLYRKIKKPSGFQRFA